MTRHAVVLMNLGGPDSLRAVRPFLFNLFNDPAIIRLPAVARVPLAWLIASRRASTARAIYERLGGASPLLANTEAQADALQAVLGNNYRCFIAMRYWRPFTRDCAAAVKQWSPDRIILLPLYPQFSTTTTASSLAAWQAEATRQRLNAPTKAIRCYPTAAGLIEALAAGIEAALAASAQQASRVRLLFSAHGLPLRIVEAGDPYPEQIAQTAAAIVDALKQKEPDWQICYQSRVGPLVWLGPSVEMELRRAARDQVGVIVVPISFVSEHSETLVELDHDYRKMAESLAVPVYLRVPTVGVDSRFIASLADLVRAAT
jgi:ferrochelatase